MDTSRGVRRTRRCTAWTLIRLDGSPSGTSGGTKGGSLSDSYQPSVAVDARTDLPIRARVVSAIRARTRAQIEEERYLGASSDVDALEVVDGGGFVVVAGSSDNTFAGRDQAVGSEAMSVVAMSAMLCTMASAPLSISGLVLLGLLA
jgi:hypothetical protein